MGAWAITTCTSCNVQTRVSGVGHDITPIVDPLPGPLAPFRFRGRLETGKGENVPGVESFTLREERS